MSNYKKPIGIFYEHPAWFKPLFKELERRKIPFVRINGARHVYNPAEAESPYSLVVNRMSSSAFTRGNGQGIFNTLNYISHLERLGTPVINGVHAQTIESSKAKQLTLLASLNIPFPATRVINHLSQVVPAALSLKFPVLIKVNVGGSGAGIVRFDTLEALQRAINLQQVSLGIDQTALVQEFIPAKGNEIIRIETLNRKFLYALKIKVPAKTFNLSPAEIYQDPEINAQTCLSDTQQRIIEVADFSPPKELVKAAELIAQEAELDIGGVEYLIDERTDKNYFYDINALSNFATDAEELVGFDPHHAFVDYIEYRLKKAYRTPTIENLVAVV